VCNLGSVNLAQHITDGELDSEKLADTVKTAIRMLDNVIDINFYPTEEAKRSNLQHRPIGLGLMGFQDALFQLRLPFESPEALDLADRTHELISYHAILASSQLARERGAYGSCKGSKWDRGIFPLDTLDMLELQRGEAVDVSRTSRLDWRPVRAHVRKYGMRNSNTMAIAPTATIANIAGCYPCIEPIYKNIYVKANISGEFTIVNRYLVEDLQRLDLWSDEMLQQIKYYDGNINHIVDIPAELKALYKEAFEVDPIWALKLTAARGKWIDQSQSHNVFLKGTSGKRLSETYLAAWRMGLKTTYYLRSLAATQIEKSTLDAARFGYTQKREYGPLAAQDKEPLAAQGSAVQGTAQGNGAEQGNGSITEGPLPGGNGAVGHIPPGQPAIDDPAVAILASPGLAPDPQLCRIGDPDCEACQ
jgi:ribonucleoside-diphosphate reductase alpha chain